MAHGKFLLVAGAMQNGEVTAMTNTGNPLRQRTWGKWFLIGVLGLVTLAVIIAMVIRSRTAGWDTKSVSVVWSEAYEYMKLENDDFKHDGFSLQYALQNNTDHDITIPESVTIMQQLTKGGVLVAYSKVAKLRAATFLPARQRAQLTVALLWGCGEYDITSNKLLKEEPPEACYARCFAGSDGLVLFDHANHLEISLPKPIFSKPKR
jgi:hypothetical protein